jgi:hypothetical protein
MTNPTAGRIRFMRAAERCLGVFINSDKALEQIGILGRADQGNEERSRDKILVEGRIAESFYKTNEEAFFCLGH